MFSVGKLIGGALNAVGLGKIAPFVSMGINLFTGNFAGLATDVMGLMSNIKGLGFLNKVAQFAPIGGFAGGGGAGGFLGGMTDLFKGSRLGDIITKFSDITKSFQDLTASTRRVSDMLSLLQDTGRNQESVRYSRETTFFSSGYTI